ncbi:hypothetical protein CYMTET_22824 [Cymbomonas tetramitiformis]|uniref:Uncharacterized protein n=1 Tax=Cymbomonas tetramitiformis TaxID=36881 RepID=A0AAE0G0K7_9CHLO|nr:hypothetical protein CYMTET_22824 [Cymbomonas tetramitiformis]
MSTTSFVDINRLQLLHLLTMFELWSVAGTLAPTSALSEDLEVIALQPELFPPTPVESNATTFSASDFSTYLSSPSFMQGYNATPPLEIEEWLVRLGVAMAQSTEEVQFLLQPPTASATGIHESFGIPPTLTPSCPKKQFTPSTSTVPPIIVDELLKLQDASKQGTLPFPITAQLHYSIPPPPKITTLGHIAKPEPINHLFFGCNLYYLDLKAMRTTFLPGGIVPCANPEWEIDMEIGATVLLGVMFTRGAADTMRLLCPKGMAIKTVGVVFHHTAVKQYTRREIHYYSHGISWLTYMQLQELRELYVSTSHLTFKVVPLLTKELAGIRPISYDYLRKLHQDVLAATATFRRRELQGVVASNSDSFGVTYFTGSAVGKKGIATHVVETGERANAVGVPSEALDHKLSMLQASSSRPGWTSLRTFYDTAPARGSEVITATRAIDVGPDCFHEEKTIISKCNNFDQRFRLLCYLVKEAYFHRNKGDEMLVDTLLMAGGPEAYALLPAPMPMQAQRVTCR